MIPAFHAEFTRLTRRRPLLIGLVAVAAYAVLVTWVLIAVAGPTGNGVSLPMLNAAGGASRPVSMAAGFGSVLVLALFIGMSAGDHSRGLWRASLLQNPARLGMAAGTFLARFALATLMIVALFAVGMVTALALASSYDLDTSAWFGSEGLRIAGEDVLRVLALVGGWAVLGTMIGVLTRSVPIGLAIGVLWAGPIENAIGEGLAFGERWFPGLLLRQVVTGVGTNTDAQLTATLLTYGVVAVALVGLVLHRRDVTS